MEALKFGVAALRRCGLAKLALFACLSVAGVAQAANYTFPGSLPSGCSGSGTSYTCGSLTLASGDTVAVTNASTTITFTALTTNNAQINVAATANLTLTVSGTMTVGTGALIKANINATYVSNAAGAATFVGNLNTTTSGAYLASGTNVTGSISATSGGGITLLGNNTVTGNITSVSGTIDLRRTVTVNGNISCTCSVYVYMYGNIGGTISSTHMNNDEGYSTFNNNITVTTSTLIVGDSSTVAGSLSSTSGSIYLQYDAVVTGNVSVSSTGVVELYDRARVNGSISTTSGYTLVYSDGVVTGNITTTSGNIDLRYRVAVSGALNCSCSIYLYHWADVGGAISGTHVNNDDGDSVIGGSITATTGSVIIGDNTTVAGSIASTSGTITLQGANVVTGTISCDCDLWVYTGVRVDGGVSVNNVYNSVGPNSVFNASVRARTGSVTLANGTQVKGDAISDSGNVNLYSSSSVLGCVRAKANSIWDIYMYSGSTAGGVCCGQGSCGSSCVFRDFGVSMPGTCALSGAVVADYRFEEASYNGTAGEVIDSSGNKRNGKIVGGATSTASGKFCRGLLIPKNLTSSVDAFDTGIDGSMIGNYGTIAFWYKSVASGTENRVLFDGTTSSSGEFYLYRADGGASAVDLTASFDANDSTLRSTSKTNVMSDGTWTHIAVTWKYTSALFGTRMTLYVNGVQKDTQTYSVLLWSGLSSAINSVYFGDNRSALSAQMNSANGYFDQIKIYDSELSAAEVASVFADTPTCTVPGPHHIEVTTTAATGPTCTPVTYTIKACADSSCSTTYTTGLTGNLTLTGSPTVTYTPAFTIGAGSDTTTVSAHVATAGTVTAGLSGLSITPSVGSIPYCGMGVAASAAGTCVYTATDAGFIFDVPDHTSNGAQTVTVSAVKSSNNATVCTPAFTTAKNVTFKCSYSNPVSGTLPVKVGTSYLNASNNSAVACDGTGQPVSLSFNASGVASTTVQYADVGQMSLTARYDGSGSDAGLVMLGSDTFWSAPYSIIPSAWTAGPIKAGQTFTATLTAYNSTGQVTRNFGQEASPQTLDFSFYRQKPTGTSAVDGAFTQQVSSFSNGVATASMTWSEVGYMDFLVQMHNLSYQGTGINASGSTGSGGNIGQFVPDHFTTTTTNACSGTFTYSGQPFTVKVTAFNANNVKVQNYDGTANTAPNYAHDVTLSAASNGGTGSMNPSVVSASSFNQGEATVSTPVFTFTNKITAPTTIAVRAQDSVYSTVTSSGFTEGSLALRSGRLRFSNAFGSEKASLTLPVQTQYWSGKSWIKSAGDSCTSVLASAVALSGYTNGQGGTGSWTTTASPITVSNGDGALTLTAPSPVTTGSVNLAINLGSTTADNACLGTHPATIGGSLSWLRSNNGNCSALNDHDPSARATFGIYTPETKKTVYVRMVE